MSLSGERSRPHVAEENFLICKALEILDEDNKNVLSEVLKCDVCLELPRGKQVKICEEGHHFCYTCHNKMKVCGICRGKLLESRNFVVEELVTKLGPILGIPSSALPPAKHSVDMSPGSYPCLHGCKNVTMPAFQVLPHLRQRHPNLVTDDLRANPYSQRFSFSYFMKFDENVLYVHSVQVSDMALFTLEMAFNSWDFFGCLRVLGDETLAQKFRHQLILKIPSVCPEGFLEFAFTGAPPSSYPKIAEDISFEKAGLKVSGRLLCEHLRRGDVMNIFFSVWEAKLKLNDTVAPVVTSVPKRFLHFENNRKIIRNRNRNARRKRLKEKLRALAAPDEDSNGLAVPNEGSNGLVVPDEGSNGLIVPEEGSNGSVVPNEGSNSLLVPDEGSNSLAVPDESSNGLVVPDEGSNGLANTLSDLAL